ncbi:MAG: transposase [Roseibium sp.]|nr:transposase [Roseibium sp.]
MAWKAAQHCLRQRDRVHLHSHVRLVKTNRNRLYFIRPGKPNENALVESFNGRQRDECMNENLFSTLS